jgi:hypothetical protein
MIGTSSNDTLEELADLLVDGSAPLELAWSTVSALSTAVSVRQVSSPTCHAH